MKRRVGASAMTGEMGSTDDSLENSETSSGHYSMLKTERRKVRKVLVERKRRERIDRCLDQLKVFLQDALPSDSQVDPPSTLEKADILELTVNHLTSLRARRHVQRAHGYNACAQEVDSFLANAHYDQRVRERMMQYLASRQTHLMQAAHIREMAVLNSGGVGVENLPMGGGLPTSSITNSFQPPSAAAGTAPTDNHSRSTDFFGHDAYSRMNTNIATVPKTRSTFTKYNYSSTNSSSADDYAHLSMCSSNNNNYATASQNYISTRRPILASSPEYNEISAVQSSDIDTTSLITSPEDVSSSSAAKRDHDDSFDVSRGYARHSTPAVRNAVVGSCRVVADNVKKSPVPFAVDEPVWRPW